GASTSPAMPLTKSCAINPVAKTQRPAFTPCANLILPAPSSTGSSGCAARDALLSLIAVGPRGGTGGQAQPWHCPRGRGRYGRPTPARGSRHRCTNQFGLLC